MLSEEFIRQKYEDCLFAVKQRIKTGQFCIIAIGGKTGSGKTSLSQYLAYQLHFSLLEMDLFLLPDAAKAKYDYKYLQKILESKKNNKRNVIIEGCSVLPVLSKFDLGEIFLIHLENTIRSARPPVELIYFENTEHCSIKEIFDIDLDSQENLKEKSCYTVNWLSH